MKLSGEARDTRDSGGYIRRWAGSVERWMESVETAEAQWFALGVTARHEKAVARMLRHKGFETLLPLYTNRHQYTHRAREFDLPCVRAKSRSRKSTPPTSLLCRRITTRSKILQQIPPDWNAMTAWMAQLRTLLAKRGGALLVKHIHDLVLEYCPSERWLDRKAADLPRAASNAASMERDFDLMRASQGVQ